MVCVFGLFVHGFVDDCGMLVDVFVYVLACLLMALSMALGVRTKKIDAAAAKHVDAAAPPTPQKNKAVTAPLAA